jgi:hypothetical protein
MDKFEDAEYVVTGIFAVAGAVLAKALLFIPRLFFKSRRSG